MLSLGMDLEGEVNNSFGFLSDMDSGTLPRKRPVVVQVQSWNDRNPPKSLHNIREWGADYLSEKNAGDRSDKSYRINQHSVTSERIYQQPSKSNGSPRHNNQNQLRDPPHPAAQHQSPSNPTSVRRAPVSNQHIGKEGSLHSGNSAFHNRALRHTEQYIDQMDAMLATQNQANSLASANQEVSARWQQAQPSHYQTPVRDIRGRYEENRHHNQGPVRDKSNYSLRENQRYPARDDVTSKLNNVQISEYRSNPGYLRGGAEERSANSFGRTDTSVKSSSQDYKGSFLLHRTNTYLDAVEALHKKNAAGETSGNNSNEWGSTVFEPPKVPDETKYQVLRKKEPTNRMSIVDPDTRPPPPAPPMPPPMPMASEEQLPPPQAPWLHDLKNRQFKLKRTPSLPRTELEPEKEPMNFKDKLKRILEGQLAAQRWPAANNKKKDDDPEVKDTSIEKSQAPYKTIKTLSKSAMKNKLEVILKDQASFHGESDMTVQRKAALNKLRTIEKDELRSQWERQDAIDDEFDTSNYYDNRGQNGRPTSSRNDPVIARQTRLMGDVVTTINLRGSKNMGTSFT